MHYFHKLFLLSVTLSLNVVFGQNTPIKFYVDEEKELVKDSLQAKYIRMIIPMSEGNFQLVDVFMNGKNQYFGFLIKPKGAKHYLKSGKHTTYYESGMKESEMYYSNGNLIGDFKSYYETGEKKELSRFSSEGKLELKKEFYTNGQLSVEEIYDKNGKLDSVAYFKPDGSKSVYQRPEYPNGMKECYKFIGKNLQYPLESVRKRETGVVKIQFNVAKDGSLSKFKVLESPSERLTQEALRVVKLMPKWQPALRDNDPVETVFTMPITFRMDF